MFARKILAALLMVGAAAAHAAYPEKTIRLVSGYATGGSVDIAAREFARHLSGVLGKTVVVENRAGASGLLAASAIANSPADGYNLYFAVGATFTVMPHMNDDSDRQSLTKLAPIGGIVDYTNVLLINNTIPAKSVPELVAYAKKHPNVVTYGSSGIGSSSHLSGEYFDQLTGAPMLHVPYKGAAPAMTDVLGGQITLFFDVTATAQQHVRGGRVKPLAVTSKTRNPAFPDVPTVAELGYPDYDVTSWFALYGHKDLPKSVVDTLANAVKTVQANPEFQKEMAKSGYLMWNGPAAAVNARVEQESRLWKQVLSKQKAAALQ